MKHIYLMRLFYFIMTFSMVFSFYPCLSTFATGTEENTDPLVAEYCSFTVTIPKKITLSGSNGYGEYDVSVSGNIGDSNILIVEPDDSFYLASVGKEDVPTEISQDKISFSNEDLSDNGSDNITKGTILASDLSAGTWSGCFNFNLSLQEVPTASSFALFKSPSTETLSLSAEEVYLDSNSSAQVDAFVNGEMVNDQVSWSSDNDAICVTDGLVKASSATKAGDSALITATYASLQKAPFLSDTVSGNAISVNNEEKEVKACFKVTVISMDFFSDTEEITALKINPNESKEVKATISPSFAEQAVTWSTNATDGLSVQTNGNTVSVVAQKDCSLEKCYELTASLGNYTKSLPIYVVALNASVDSVHVCEYEESVTREPSCLDAGERTFTCSCGDSYSEVIPATGHLFKDGVCEYCGKAEPTEEASSDDADVEDSSGHVCEFTESVIREPSCLDEGVKEFVCTCGDSHTEAIPATGHQYTEGICKQCGDTVSSENTGDSDKNSHDDSSALEDAFVHSCKYEGSVTREPSCLDAGERTFTCSCGNSYTEVISATGHLYTDGVCEHCGDTIPVEETEH